MIRKFVITFLLLMTLATAQFWALSFWRPALGRWPSEIGSWSLGFVLDRGRLTVHYWRFADEPTPGGTRALKLGFLDARTEAEPGCVSLWRDDLNPYFGMSVRRSSPLGKISGRGCRHIRSNHIAMIQQTKGGTLSPAPGAALCTNLSVAFGLLIPLFAVYPLSALTLTFIRGPVRRWRRRRKGLCLNCGYDLTGLPECRCPECGRRFDRPAAAPAPGAPPSQNLV